MDRYVKNFFSRLNKTDEYFSKIIEKLTNQEYMTNEELSYVLGLSLLFSNEYRINKKPGYFEFSYYLVLCYSLRTGDLNPLLDFSINNGFYPIAKSILSISGDSIFNSLLSIGISNYTVNDMVELKEQKEKIDNLINSHTAYRAFIAPTSYGKSSFILDDIRQQEAKYIGIIVPKKALIWQTYRNIKVLAKELSYKVLMHDTEYNGESRFIGIFTQERAIRLLQDNNICFDILYVDEAHNLFQKDERNLLLARLIKLNRKLNSRQKVVFLSPLINDINNLKMNNQEIIDMQKIEFNIKEYHIKFLNKQNICYNYNRFVNCFYNDGQAFENWYDFLSKTSKNKNLIYLNKPKDIEKFAKYLIKLLPDIDDPELIIISGILEKYVDKEYIMSNLIKKGVLYIHGKVPDMIKDYLLEKFKICNGIKYLISNSSILEGVNFPIECLYILDVYGLSGKDLKNLCGRVNRLNEIFSIPGKLDKLFCPIYFIEIIEAKTNFLNKIELLRCDEVDDVRNPLLLNSKMDFDEKKKIIDLENSFIDNHKDSSIKNLLIKNNINGFYHNFEVAIKRIEEQIRLSPKANNIEELIDLIFSIFIERFEIEEINNYELWRLKSEPTRSFYKNYLDSIFYADIKTKIKYFMKYFSYYEEMNMKFYIGESFGEVSYKSMTYSGNRCTYIDISSKNNNERINLSVIKSKLEDDFISYKLSKCVRALLDLNMISEDVYNKFLYNTTNKHIIELINAGISYQMINFINENNLNNEIRVVDSGIEVSRKFRKILEKQDDFIKFEIGKII